MNSYVHIFIMISYFFIITQKEIKKVDLSLKSLLIRIFFSISITSITIYFLFPEYFSEHSSLLKYVVTWLLVLISYFGHWMYKKKIRKNEIG